MSGGAARKNAGILRERPKSKMAAIDHVGNNMFNGLPYNTAYNMIFGTFLAKEPIIDVILMIWTYFDL